MKKLRFVSCVLGLLGLIGLVWSVLHSNESSDLKTVLFVLLVFAMSNVIGDAVKVWESLNEGPHA